MARNYILPILACLVCSLAFTNAALAYPYVAYVSQEKTSQSSYQTVPIGFVGGSPAYCIEDDCYLVYGNKIQLYNVSLFAQSDPIDGHDTVMVYSSLNLVSF